MPKLPCTGFIDQGATSVCRKDLNHPPTALGGIFAFVQSHDGPKMQTPSNALLLSFILLVQ